GREFVKREADVLDRGGVQENRRPSDLGAWLSTERFEVGADQIVHPCAAPMFSEQEILRLGQPLDTPVELTDERVDRGTLAGGLESHSFHDGKLVFCAVSQFAHEEVGMLRALG